MKPKKSFLALALVIRLLALCSKKPANDANSQNPPDHSPSTTAQVPPPAAAPPAAAPALAPTPVSPPPLPKPVVTPAGTVSTAGMQHELTSKANNQQYPFEVTRTEPIVADGKTVAPAGTGGARYFKGGVRPGMTLASLSIQGVSVPAESAVSFQMTNWLTSKSSTATTSGSPPPQ